MTMSTVLNISLKLTAELPYWRSKLDVESTSKYYSSPGLGFNGWRGGPSSPLHKRSFGNAARSRPVRGPLFRSSVRVAIHQVVRRGVPVWQRPYQQPNSAEQLRALVEAM